LHNESFRLSVQLYAPLHEDRRYYQCHAQEFPFTGINPSLHSSPLYMPETEGVEHFPPQQLRTVSAIGNPLTRTGRVYCIPSTVINPAVGIRCPVAEDFSYSAEILPNHPENPVFRKKPVFRAFLAKPFIILRDYVDALPHITGCTGFGCNKISENEKTSPQSL
jgi:hypothetical protein